MQAIEVGGGVPSRYRVRDAMAFHGGRTGGVVVYVEGGRDVVLARVSSAGEAQNVPRVLARADVPVDAVSVAATGTGYLIAWSTRDDHGVYAVTTDALGVPRLPPRRVV